MLTLTTALVGIFGIGALVVSFILLFSAHQTIPGLIALLLSIINFGLAFGLSRRSKLAGGLGIIIFGLLTISGFFLSRHPLDFVRPVLALLTLLIIICSWKHLN